ncbi:hypothetical protein [Clostridium scatologenes]|uniref:Cardb domain protein n=1 Tax=Clostridium scatologenes TaxID=1548 RepID=A0A0E3GR73_CLOSL|nr:hypothetical protein [Clostridium scatologenes]AKA69821.1 cardb domain protein [Clostridium scatologenes]
MIPIKIGTEIKQIKGIYYKIGNEVKRLLVKSKVGSEIKDFIKYTIQKLLTYDFTESTSQSMSNTFNFSNLISVDEVTVNNGNVSYTKNQDNVIVSVSNGTVSRSAYDSTKYATYKEEYRDSSSNSFASSISSSSGGYSGTLYASGGSYVASGSYIPSDSKEATGTRTLGGFNNFEWNKYNNNLWAPMGSSVAPAAGIYYYEDSNGYSGSLGFAGGQSNYTIGSGMPTTNGTVDGQTSTAYFPDYWLYNYKGTVTRLAVDTRVYRQKYTGYLYQGGYTNYYKYKINIKYTIKN